VNEDPRVTAAREVLAETNAAIDAPDPDLLDWSPHMVAARHARLRSALALLLAYVDEEES